MSDTIHKQASLFSGQIEPDEDDSKYSGKIEAPIYEPKNKKPHLIELVDLSKSNSLIREILASDIPQDVKEFLIEAAKGIAYLIMKRLNSALLETSHRN